MTEILETPFHDIQREVLQDRLTLIDRDPIALQSLIKELYGGDSENPHILYVAATHLTSLSYLDRRDEHDTPVLPSKAEAARGFVSYTRLLNMLSEESKAPLYAENKRVSRRLVGMREELAFHATLAYATSQGADFVALPSPTQLDFHGAKEASDIHVFFPESEMPPFELQVTFNPEDKLARGHNYHPRIPVLSLSTAIGSAETAMQVRDMLRGIGKREETMFGRIKLRKHERTLLLDAAASILTSAQAWIQD